MKPLLRLLFFATLILAIGGGVIVAAQRVESSLQRVDALVRDANALVKVIHKLVSNNGEVGP